MANHMEAISLHLRTFLTITIHHIPHTKKDPPHSNLVSGVATPGTLSPNSATSFSLHPDSEIVLVRMLADSADVAADTAVQSHIEKVAKVIAHQICFANYGKINK